MALATPDWRLYRTVIFRFKEELAEKYLHEVYPDYTGEEEDEYEEEEFPIPENMKQDFFESSEYEYYVETAKELIKRIQKYLNKPEDEKIYVINKQNHLLISYDDKTESADDSEWGRNMLVPSSTSKSLRQN